MLAFQGWLNIKYILSCRKIKDLNVNQDDVLAVLATSDLETKCDEQVGKLVTQICRLFHAPTFLRAQHGCDAQHPFHRLTLTLQNLLLAKRAKSRKLQNPNAHLRVQRHRVIFTFLGKFISLGRSGFFFILFVPLVVPSIFSLVAF